MIINTNPLILALVGVTLGSNTSQLHFLDVDCLKLVAVSIRVLIEISSQLIQIKVGHSIIQSGSSWVIE